MTKPRKGRRIPFVPSDEWGENRPFLLTTGEARYYVDKRIPYPLTEREYQFMARLPTEKPPSYAGNPPSDFAGWVTTTHDPLGDIDHHDWEQEAFMNGGWT